MSPELKVVLILIVFFTLIFIGFPIAYTLLATSVIFIIAYSGAKPLFSIYAATMHAFTRDAYVAIPLYVFMATVFVQSGIGAQMYEAMYKWFAGLRGGLLVGTTLMSTLIAAITGLTSTAILTMGVMGFPEMEKRGYSRFLTLGVIPFGGAIGPIIPPSIHMIVVAIFAEQSVGKMFMGGMMPGLAMAFLVMVYVIVFCWLKPSAGPAVPKGERASYREKLRGSVGLILPIGIIITILGAIYLGIATPTEAGSVGAAGALVSAAINRKFNLPMLRAALLQAFRINAMILWILLGGIAVSAMFALTGIGTVVKDIFSGLEMSPMGFIWIMMLIPLVLGCVMNTLPVTIIMLPIFIPIIRELGMDTLWFSVLFSINTSIGVLTPPFGMDIFIMKGIVPPEIGMGEIFKAVIPPSLIMILVLFIGVYWPPLITWLPGMMMGK